MSVWCPQEAVLDPTVPEPSIGGIVAGDRIGAAIAFRDQHIRLAPDFINAWRTASARLRDRATFFAASPVLSV